MKCRHCNSEVTTTFIDLGSAPPSNAYLTSQTLHMPEKWFPLRVLVCTECWLVQTEDFADASELFDDDYAYFSSFSCTWLAHAERYVADMTKRFGLNKTSHVVEVAANDGYLLQYVKERNIPCLGIEPTTSTATAARKKGIDVVEDFFGVQLALELVSQGKQADLTVANNVLAHVPDINDFVAGFSVLLKPEGVATFEFPHLLRLIEKNQFDTIYHEHFSYLSLHAVKRIFEHNGLAVFDVEEYATHGGSLRVFAQKKDPRLHPTSLRVSELLKREAEVGMTTVHFYAGFQARADKIRDDLIAFLDNARNEGTKVAAYGAAAKGNTLINYCGIEGTGTIEYVVDRSPHKQGMYLPGSHIPIVCEDHLKDDKPDYVMILPWNLREEISKQLEYIRKWDGRFVTAVPELEVA